MPVMLLMRSMMLRLLTFDSKYDVFLYRTSLCGVGDFRNHGLMITMIRLMMGNGQLMRIFRQLGVRELRLKWALVKVRI